MFEFFPRVILSLFNHLFHHFSPYPRRLCAALSPVTWCKSWLKSRKKYSEIWLFKWGATGSAELWFFVTRKGRGAKMEKENYTVWKFFFLLVKDKNLVCLCWFRCENFHTSSSSTSSNIDEINLARWLKEVLRLSSWEEEKKVDTDEYLFSTLLSPTTEIWWYRRKFHFSSHIFLSSTERKKTEKRNIYLNVCPAERKKKLTRTFCGYAFEILWGSSWVHC